jgi:hypothetical protein
LDEPSLHLTVSLTPPTALDYLGWVMSRLRAAPELRASLSAHDTAAQAATADAISGLMLQALGQSPLSEFLREWEANIRPSPHIRLPEAAYEQFSPITETSRIRLASLHKLFFFSQSEDFSFAAAGRIWTVPKVLQPALAQLHNSREIAVSELAAALPPSAKADLLKSLAVLAQAGVVLVANS